METDPIKLNDAAPAKKLLPPPTGIFAMLLIVIAVLVEIWQIGRDAELQTFWGHIHNGTTADFTKAWAEHGNNLREIAPVGNITVIYSGFDPANTGHVDYAAQSHFLGEYQIYPRRVFTADETKVINKGVDVINPTFSPTIEWLQQNGVQTVATYKMTGLNQLQISTAMVPPAAPRQGGR